MIFLREQFFLCELHRLKKNNTVQIIVNHKDAV